MNNLSIKIRKVITLIHFIIKNPHKIGVAIKKSINKPKLKKLGLKYMDPNYIFFDEFKNDSVAFDYSGESVQWIPG